MELKRETVDKEPWEWQEAHSPTEIVKLKFEDSKVPVFCRRRVQDARIWRKIEENHFEREAIRLCRGFHYICWGGMCRVSNILNSMERAGLERSLSDEEFWEYLGRCKADYLEWVKSCEREKINRFAIMDLLYFSLSAREVERNFRKKHGWAVRTLIKGLGLYR